MTTLEDIRTYFADRFLALSSQGLIDNDVSIYPIRNYSKLALPATPFMVKLPRKKTAIDKFVEQGKNFTHEEKFFSREPIILGIEYSIVTHKSLK
jgi:hypothetical protein